MSRSDFEESWLVEHPQRVMVGDVFPELTRSIRERSNYDSPIHDSCWKIIGVHTSYFWIEIDQEIVVAMETSNRPQCLVVNAVGKNPKFRGSPPYAADLYQAVLVTQALPLMSDELLSDGGMSIWDRFLKQDGYSVLVYDQKHPGKSYALIDDLRPYLDDRKYRFVLMRKDQIAETQSFFGTRRLRENAGLL